MELCAFDGPVWRLLVKNLVEAPCAPVRSPHGRFHHPGQFAVYASLSAEGADVAIQRYLVDQSPRVLVPLWLGAKAVADVRGDASASIVWQGFVESGDPSPTWKISDAARQQGAQAMLYSSRSRPDLSHVVVFEADCLTVLGSA
jgi:hypothetical protein